MRSLGSKRRIGVGLIVAGLAFVGLFGATAAASGPATLHNTTAAEDCSGQASGQIGWVFVDPHGDFVTPVTATFTNAGTVTGVILSNPKFSVISTVSTSDTLISGTATVTDTFGTFNLTHICTIVTTTTTQEVTTSTTTVPETTTTTVEESSTTTLPEQTSTTTLPSETSTTLPEVPTTLPEVTSTTTPGESTSTTAALSSSTTTVPAGSPTTTSTPGPLPLSSPNATLEGPAPELAFTGSNWFVAAVGAILLLMGLFVLALCKAAARGDAAMGTYEWDDHKNGS